LPPPPYTPPPLDAADETVVEAVKAGAWVCRGCAFVLHVRYEYPTSPWLHCARRGCAMPAEEQVVALARFQRESAETHQPSAPPAPSEEALLLTVANVGKLLGKTPAAVYKMIERNQLAGVTRIAGRVYVRRADLLRSLAEGRVPSPEGRR
jgi:hypothetical protein